MAFTLLKNLQETKSELRVTHSKLEDKLKGNEQWRSANNRILKGLSSKEIAVVRQTSEKTLRQQASVIYQKSLLPERTELYACFLDDYLIEQKNIAF